MSPVLLVFMDLTGAKSQILPLLMPVSGKSFRLHFFPSKIIFSYRHVSGPLSFYGSHRCEIPDLHEKIERLLPPRSVPVTGRRLK